MHASIGEHNFGRKRELWKIFSFIFKCCVKCKIKESYFKFQSISISVGQGTANPVPCRKLQTAATQKSHRSSVFKSVQTGVKWKPCFTRMNTNVPVLTSDTEALHHIIPPDCALETEIDKPVFTVLRSWFHVYQGVRYVRPPSKPLWNSSAVRFCTSSPTGRSAIRLSAPPGKPRKHRPLFFHPGRGWKKPPTSFCARQQKTWNTGVKLLLSTVTHSSPSSTPVAIEAATEGVKRKKVKVFDSPAVPAAAPANKHLRRCKYGPSLLICVWNIVSV